MAKKNKNWMMLGFILVLAGGLVHALQPLGVNLLNFNGGGLVQFIAGVGSVWVAIWKLRAKKF